MRHLMPRFAFCALLVGCSAAPNPPVTNSSGPSSTNPPFASKSPSPPRWFLEVGTRWVEKTESGLHRVVAGSRFETQGRHIVGVADKPDSLEDARVAPPWSTSGQTPCRYVFLRDREVFVAFSWLGEARLLGTLSMPVQDSFDWLDGVGLVTNAGTFVVRTAGCTIDKLELPGVATAHALNAQTAVVLTALGHARLTLDGGKTFRDVSADLPGATSVKRVGNDLHVLTSGEQLFVIDAQGAIKPGKRVEQPRRDEPPPELEDRWPTEHGIHSPLQAAVMTGLVLPNGDALVADDGLVARVDLRTGIATEVLRFGSEGEQCLPVTMNDRALIVCESARRATVIDAGSGHVERSFDLEQEPVWDRFVAVDGEALGFVGSCAGRTAAPAVDVVTSASPMNNSTQRSQTFCVRTTSGGWVEHRVDPEDATDLLAWIPRSDGGAVALVAMPGTFVHNTPRVNVRGTLRVVRVARNEAPLDISPYLGEAPKLLSRSLHALPDGTIEGWISSGHSASSLMAITIDPMGKPKQRPFPSRTGTLLTAGRFAIARTEDGLYFETTDYGRHFQPIDPPPGKRTDPIATSAVGAQIGPFLRVGWGASAVTQTAEVPPTDTSTAMQVRRLPPVVRLGCRTSGPTTSSRVSDSFSVGFTKTPTPQMSPGRIALAGAFYVPWRGMPASTATGDAEFVFIPFFDLAAPVRRATVPLSRLDPQQQVFHEIKLGFVLDGNTVWPVAAERYDQCAAPLIDEAGLTVSLDACVSDPTVGVNMDGRLVLVHQPVSYIQQDVGQVVISTADLAKAPSGQTKLRGTNLKQVATLEVPGGISRFKLAVGRRGKTPVAVLIDASGNALLAPIDPNRGTFGTEEPLVPLSKLRLGTDAACAETADDARLVLPFTTEIGLDTQGFLGIREAEHGGLAILRWSNQHVCLEAIDRAIHDERHEADLAFHSVHGPVRKIVARFDKQNQGKGTLVLLTYGTELRQPITCDRVSP